MIGARQDTTATSIRIDRDGAMLAVFIDGQRMFGIDRKNALRFSAALCRAATDWDDLPWLVE